MPEIVPVRRRELLYPLELVRKECLDSLKEPAGMVLVARALALDFTPTARNGTRGNHRKHIRQRPAAMWATTLWM